MVAKISVDTRQLQRYARHLETFASKAVPYAVRNGLNGVAFAARTEWVEQMGKAFTLRNTYTTRSPRVVKATARRTISSMQSALGSPLGYLADQESGFTRQKKGKHGVPIPTATAAGQTSRRTRSVRRKNYLSALSVSKQPGRSRQQRNVVAIKLAAKTGGVAYLDLGRRRGLFRIEGRKKGIRIRMLYDLSRPSVTSRSRPTMERTLTALAPRIERIHADALRAELKRQKVLLYGVWDK